MIALGTPRFREPPEPRFRPCEGDLTREEFAVAVPELGLDEVIVEADVPWRRHRDGTFTWYVTDVHVSGVTFPFSVRAQGVDHFDEQLARLFGAKLAERIERCHAERIEERCAEEAERDG